MNMNVECVQDSEDHDSRTFSRSSIIDDFFWCWLKHEDGDVLNVNILIRNLNFRSHICSDSNDLGTSGYVRTTDIVRRAVNTSSFLVACVASSADRKETIKRTSRCGRQRCLKADSVLILDILYSRKTKGSDPWTQLMMNIKAGILLAQGELNENLHWK